MARDDDDRDRSGLWISLIILLLLLAGGFFVWRWFASAPDKYVAPTVGEATVDVTVDEGSYDIDEPPLDDASDPFDYSDERDFEPDFSADGYGENDPDLADLPVIEEVVPEPPDPVDFNVYFELMEWRLTDAARSSLDAQLAGFDPALAQEVKVDGHTDTAGTTSYNRPLSVRRAQIVRRYLIDNGVPRGVIEMQGHGESQLAKPTADGVREPMNRRAEVSIRFE